MSRRSNRLVRGLLIRRSLNRGLIGAPKTRHGRRDGPLTKAMARELWNARKAPAVEAGEEALIFPASDSGYLDRAQVYPVQVQKMLGHHSPAFTLEVYVHLLPDDLPGSGAVA